MPVPTVAVGAIEQRWPDVRRIAVLRGGGLGDLLMAVPAMEALGAAYPDAELVLLCAPPHTALLTTRPSPVSRALPLPQVPGIYDPANDGGYPPEQDRFWDWMRRHPIDLGVQLHGGGASSNPFVKSLRPKWTVGARADDAEPLTRWIPYRLYQHEVLRWLEVAGLAGAPPVTLEPSIAVTDADRQRAEQVMPSSSGPVVAVHAGARDARRRWPAKHFATVVSQCVNDGARVVIVGTPHEQELMREIAERARATVPCADADAVVTLSDLDLSALCGVLARCDVLVGNDSGVRHLAKAVGTATVGIFWLPNVFHYAPLGRSRDRVLMSWTSRCTVCDRDCVSAAPCSHDSSFVSDISPDAVMKELRDLLV
ncbi:glycosyltransferase family 9 protein [Mycobacterium noviomagense]|uniref:Glycosyl transferase family 9 n=1 Tax=Mycobacterium noviomagense TaxID=459858 RepID=A0A7I7PG26_9MYCO|nr:glycosyltransferase family 9 protein [Mycobacterium noviomagense]BBY07584.1 glycosyl transferase family 9 [Mycobacterium noviomagense]